MNSIVEKFAGIKDEFGFKVNTHNETFPSGKRDRISVRYGSHPILIFERKQSAAASALNKLIKLELKLSYPKNIGDFQIEKKTFFTRLMNLFSSKKYFNFKVNYTSELSERFKNEIKNKRWRLFEKVSVRAEGHNLNLSVKTHYDEQVELILPFIINLIKDCYESISAER